MMRMGPSLTLWIRPSSRSLYVELRPTPTALPQSRMRHPTLPRSHLVSPVVVPVRPPLQPCVRGRSEGYGLIDAGRRQEMVGNYFRGFPTVLAAS